MTMQAIKDAILALPEKDRLDLENWLADQWDSRMERDFAHGGRGANLVEQVDAEIDAGQFRDFQR